MTDASEPLVLRPDRGTVGRWAIAALVALGVFVWAFIDSRGHFLAIIAVTFAAVVAAFFVLQFIAPRLFQVVLTESGLHARLLTSRAELDWDHVHVARVISVAGEPYLELQIREPSPTGDPWRTRTTGVWLPTGCDIKALHRFLARRLGRGGLRPPRTVTPIPLDEEPT
ncbi:MAG: hypothetical protein R3320_14225 [Nitriliruptorales bacterium]|nr:hypothetical protein [Nitriliruptorales bacterium]